MDEKTMDAFTPLFQQELDSTAKQATPFAIGFVLLATLALVQLWQGDVRYRNSGALSLLFLGLTAARVVLMRHRMVKWDRQAMAGESPPGLREEE